MIYSTLMAASVQTPEWSPNVAIIMIFCNLFVISIGRYAIKQRGQGPSLPVAMPDLFEGFGLPELLATTSLGHVLGAGMILGLGSAGVL